MYIGAQEVEISKKLGEYHPTFRFMIDKLLLFQRRLSLSSPFLSQQIRQIDSVLYFLALKCRNLTNYFDWQKLYIFDVKFVKLRLFCTTLHQNVMIWRIIFNWKICPFLSKINRQITIGLYNFVNWRIFFECRKIFVSSGLRSTFIPSYTIKWLILLQVTKIMFGHLSI